MDFGQLFQAALALVFVIGLILITLWLIKFCQQKGLTEKFNSLGGKNNRLAIIEQRRIDAKNNLVLIKCDSDEFLILIGTTNMLLKSSSTKDSNHA